jgi:hypothetical protein
MAVIVVCALLVLAGVVAVVRWGGLPVQPPPAPVAPLAPPTAADDPADPPSAEPPSEVSTDPPAGPPPAGLVARRYLWYVNLALAAGFGAGLVAAGAGGRLVMRLLAVTAGPGAQGRITEAEQEVGRISVGGTIGFVVFTALFFGLATGVLYLLLRRWLPVGRMGGLAYGALLLVIAGSRLEPLRRGNPDFDLVGPGWVSVAAFTALVVFHGMLVAALAGRISRAVPLLGTRPAAIAAHAPLLLLAPLAPVAVIVAVVGALVVLATRIPAVLQAWRRPSLARGGRIALVLLALLALPGFLGDIADILGRP